jgi:tetratricopeptide (TPR) repeat protein
MSRKTKKDKKSLSTSQAAFIPRDIPEGRPEKILGFIAIAVVFLMALLLSLRNIQEVDLGFHLRAGEWILQNKTFPKNDPFTYTVTDHPYIDLHWIYQIFLFIFYRIGGSLFLVISHSIFMLSAFYLVTIVSRRYLKSPAAIAPLLFLAVLSSELRFMIRPETASWLLLAITFLILERYSEGKPSPLWLLPVIQLFWVNMQGLFILGWFLMGSFFIGDFLEKRKMDRRFAFWCGAAILVCFINPYLHRGVLFPLTLFTRMGSENPFGQNISEFTSPWHLKLTFVYPFYPRFCLWSYYTFSFLSIMLLLLTWRRHKVWEFLVFTGFFILSVQMIRNIPLFILPALPITAKSFSALGEMMFPTGKKAKPYPFLIRLNDLYTNPWFKRTLAASVIILCLGISLCVITNAYYISDRREDRFGYSLSEQFLPMDSARFLKKNNVSGKIFNHLNYGGFLMWQLEKPVFIDGRLEVMGEDFYREYLTAESERKLNVLLDKYNADIVIFPFLKAQSWLLQLRKHPDWRLAYFDHSTAIFLRNGTNPQIPGASFPDRTFENLSIPITSEQRTALLYAPRKKGFSKWIRGFYRKQFYPSRSMYQSLFFYFLDDLNRAEAFQLEALEQSSGSYFEIYNNLGAIYNKAGKKSEASYCYRIVLEEQPENEFARRRINP